MAAGSGGRFRHHEKPPEERKEETAIALRHLSEGMKRPVPDVSDFFTNYLKDILKKGVNKKGRAFAKIANIDVQHFNEWLKQKGLESEFSEIFNTLWSNRFRPVLGALNSNIFFDYRMKKKFGKSREEIEILAREAKRRVAILEKWLSIYRGFFEGNEEFTRRKFEVLESFYVGGKGGFREKSNKPPSFEEVISMPGSPMESSMASIGFFISIYGKKGEELVKKFMQEYGRPPGMEITFGVEKINVETDKDFHRNFLRRELGKLGEKNLKPMIKELEDMVEVSSAGLRI